MNRGYYYNCVSDLIIWHFSSPLLNKVGENTGKFNLNPQEIPHNQRPHLMHQAEFIQCQFSIILHTVHVN